MRLNLLLLLLPLVSALKFELEPTGDGVAPEIRDIVSSHRHVDSFQLEEAVRLARIPAHQKTGQKRHVVETLLIFVLYMVMTAINTKISIVQKWGMVNYEEKRKTNRERTRNGEKRRFM